MDNPVDQQAVAERTTGRGIGVGLMIGWLIAGGLLLGSAALLPLERTQEARVLQTSREMLGQGWEGWLIPHVNGRVRLEKPPLAYWLTAGSYRVFGVSVFAGRLPMVVLAWLTVGMTYVIGRGLFNRRVGALAAGALAGCLLFCRYGALAETDILVTFFVTVAVYAIWRGWDAQRDDPECEQEEPKGASAAAMAWYHVAAIATALTILSKGPPGVFPVLFLIGLVAATNRWRVLLGSLFSGASLTLLGIALPWFLYVRQTPEAQIIGKEAAIALTGYDHKGAFWYYLPVLLKASLPYVGFLILGLVAAVQQCRRSASMRVVLVWLAVILLPLTLIGQKQEHYMLPLMPGLMIVVGWVLERGLWGGDATLSRATALVLVWTAIAGLVAAPAAIVAGFVVRQRVTGVDVALAATLAAATAGVLLVHRRRGLRSSAAALVAGVAVLMPLAYGVWAPTPQDTTRTQIASEIRARFGQGPYAFWGQESMTLSFLIGQPMRTYTRQSDLAEALRKMPNLVVLFDKGKKKDAAGPAGMLEQTTVQTVGVYRALVPDNDRSGGGG